MLCFLRKVKCFFSFCICPHLFLTVRELYVLSSFIQSNQVEAIFPLVSEIWLVCVVCYWRDNGRLGIKFVSDRYSIDEISRGDSVIIMYEPIVCSTDSDILYNYYTRGWDIGYYIIFYCGDYPGCWQLYLEFSLVYVRGAGIVYRQ